MKTLSIIYPHNQRLMVGRAHDVMIMKTCHSLASEGHNVKIITGKPAREENIFHYYGLRPIPELEIIQVPMLRGRPFSWHTIFNLFCLFKIMDLKKKGMADIIHLREIKLAIFLLRFKRMLDIPFVVEVHDLKIKKFYDSCPEINEKEAYVFQKVDGIVVLLNTFGDILKETYGIDSIPISKIPLAAEKKPFFYKQSGRKIIGYVGQLYPMQGVDLLIKALKYLPNARLSVIGGGEKDLDRLKGLASAEMVDKRIDFHGFVQPHMVAEKAREADVMVICAIDEGKRRYSAHTKLYEYMAMGKPIVAVDLPSIREEVVDGKNALIAKPGDPKDLAEKIESVLNNPVLAGTLANNAHKSAEEFTWEKRAQRLSSFFEEVWKNYQRHP